MPRAALRPGGQVLCALVAGVALLSSCTGTPEPERQPLKLSELSGELIAFSADLDGNWDFYDGDADIFLLDPGGGRVHNVTRHPANDFSPEWSPDGKRIRFSDQPRREP